MKKYFIPGSRGEKTLWLANYKAKIAVHGATIGLTPAEVTAQQTSCDNITAEIGNTNSMYSDYLEQVEIERSVMATNLLTITSNVSRQKTHPAFTTAIGDDLGTIGDEQTMDIANAKPTLKLQQNTEGWVIIFSLKRFFDSLKIERKRPTGNFTFLAIDTASPYVDSDAQENGTEYRAVFMLHDAPVGQWSDTVRVQL